MDYEGKIRAFYSEKTGVHYPSPVKCVSPLRGKVPRLSLRPVSDPLLSSIDSFRSSATLRKSLQTFSNPFTSPRIVRASHDLELPVNTERESKRRKLRTRPTVVLIGRKHRPVCANLLMDRPLSYV